MPTKKQKNFESNLLRLSEIVEEVENPATPLEKSLNLYKEGLTLAATCGESLKTYEQEILILQKAADETFNLKPFESSITK